MIPKKIHYCWFGRGQMPDFALRCIESWHEVMPDYEYKLWNEDNFDIDGNVYVQEAYEAGKYAFVSDYVRLHALAEEGGIYMDVDFMTYKPFDDLLSYDAFAGFEGSKYNPLMMGVIASRAGGLWVREVLSYYQDRHFMIDGTPDYTTNVQFVSRKMKENGFVQNGLEQDYLDLHIFPVEYFCPRLTTGEYKRNHNTYCESVGTPSWRKPTLKGRLLSLLPPALRTSLILLKRRILG